MTAAQIPLFGEPPIVPQPVQKRSAKTGKFLKEHGMRRALEHVEAARKGWTDEACARLIQFAASRPTFRMEEFRAWVRGVLPEPTSHHAWGAFTNVAVRREIIRWTGAYQAAESPETHGHPVKLWQSTNSLV